MALLQAEIARRDLGPDDAVFTCEDGRPLPDAVYRRVWRQARAAVLESDEIDSPLGRRVSDLRTACIAAWLRNGDQSAAHVVMVAECADLTASRIAERFSHCLRRPKPTEIPWDRLEVAQCLPAPQSDLMTAARR
ncbi:hypothetical protein ACFWTC_10415 [Streptomyces sp. NPDC058619]|uniref:hypothetical protein n=1 Tax=Streptomyces sp. NPDC058619 TaxID=3346559 RepID=UPI0036476B98